MSKRTSLMVAYDILQVAMGGSTKTNLVYQGNLNFKIVKRWLAKLIAKGLLEFTPIPTNTWTTTLKGVGFMSAMEKTMAIWDDGLINLNELNLEAI